jgi:hypothetical protein
MSEFYDPNIPVGTNFEAEGIPMGPPASTSDRQGNPNRNAENFLRALGEYFQDYNVAKEVRETTTAFVLGLEGMERNLVEIGMLQVIDQLRAGSDDIDNPLRTGFLSRLGFLSDYTPSLVKFFEGTFGDNDTISNIEFGSAFGIPAETITEYDNSVLNVQEAKDIYKEVTGQELTDEEAEQMIESAGEVSEADFGTYVKENVEKSLAESLGGLAQSVLDVLFGTKRGGGSKSIEEILKEQMDLILPPSPSSPNYDQEMTEWIKRQSGSIISINHVPNAANPVFAGVRFPVPIPVSGPEIIIPIFDQAGVYQGGTPVDMANLVIDRVGNVITETGTKIGEMKDNVLRVFDEAGNVVRAVALEGGTDPTTGLAVYTPAGWTEGDPNPFDIKDSDGDGVIDAQTDAAGNPVDDNGIPINKEPDENDEETPETAWEQEGDDALGTIGGPAGSFPDDIDPNDYVTQQQLADAINALDIPTDTVRTDEEIKQIAQGIVDNLDLPEDTQISDEDLASAISTYLTNNGYIAGDTTRTDEEINDLINTALTDYATVQGVQDTLDTYFGEDGTVTATLTALGYDTDEIEDILGTPAGYVDPITGEVTEEATGVFAAIEGAATPQDIINAVGIPPAYDDAGELVAGTGTGLYGEMLAAGATINDIEEAIGNQDEGTGLYGYIDAAVQDLATVADVERIVGVPDIDEETGELTDKSTGLYLDFYNAGVDYDTVINLIGVPDDPSTPDVDEGRGLFGYVGQSSQNVQDYIDTVLGDVPGQITTLVEYVGVPGDPETGEGATGLHKILLDQGVAIEALPGIIEGIVGVPEIVDGEIVGGTGIYGQVYDLNLDVNDVITSINDTIIPEITSISGFLGTPGAEVDDPNTEIDETLPTGLFATIEANRAAGETERDAIIDAINTFTSDGQYTIEQVLTAISDSNTDLKNFIGSPGADVDDPNTPEDETLPTGIYAGIAGSESTILDAISESEDNTEEYLTYISNIIGIPASEITQEDVDGIVGLLGEEEAITEINNDIRLYDANFDGVINDIDIGLLQGFVDAGVEGVGEIPATGLYADAAQRQLELQGYIDDSDKITRGLIAQEGKDTRQLVGQTALFNAMLGAGDATGRRVDVSTPDPARINYIYDFADIFATPQQKGLFPSPYGGPQRAQQQQIAQKRSIMSGPLQIGGMAQGGKVDYDFTDEIMQIMSYGDNQ